MTDIILSSGDTQIQKCIELLKKQDNYEPFINSLLNIKKEKLFISKFHGLYHSQKVCFFAIVLASMLNLNKTDIQIIIDAALYHDIGRDSEYEDSLHGLISANKIDDIISENPIYKEKENLQILKAIMDSHSQKDNNYRVDNVIETYEISDVERFKILDKILRDADALDRYRFNKDSNAYLDINKLSLDESKSLVNVAEKTNQIYFNTIEIFLDNSINVDKTKEVGCFHGIGYDLFNIENILKYGILSSSEQLKINVNAPRNFLGSNQKYWISVVDEEKIKNSNTGFTSFIKDGISFYVFVPKLFDGYDGSYASVAYDTGYPVKSKEHEDEKFVYKRILPEKIYGIVIPKEKYNEPLNNLNYMHCNDRYTIVNQKVLHYYNSIKKYFNITPSTEKVNVLLRQYKEEYYRKNANIDEYLKIVNKLKNEINIEIQNWIQSAFNQIMQLDRDVTLVEAINYMLKTINIKYDLLNSGEELIYIIDKSYLNETINSKKL